MNVPDLYRLLKAHGVEDVLRHFPVRYESLLPCGNVQAPKDHERFVLRGYPFQVKSVTARGTSIVRFRIKSDVSNLPALLCNQAFYLPKLYKGQELLFVMSYSEARKAYLVLSIHDSESYFAQTGIRPVYSLPKGISQSYFSSYLRKILMPGGEADDVASPLPGRLVEKYRLMKEKDAFRAVHFPRTDEELRRGLRVFKYEEALSYAVRSLMLRKKAEGRKKSVSLPIDRRKINAKIKSLPYHLTHDQVVAIREIVLDMEGSKVMYRLLQGDVGTGKTIVSLLALYANALRHRQGVLMAPTFELASQHYRNALSFFQETGLSVAFLASGVALSAKERREILRRLREGEVSVLVATHAALSEKIQFQDLGLAIIDEQQLFGVRQRDQLLQKGDSDLLMVTATPIPRTLSQVVNSDIDVSTLEQYPFGKRNVKTKVIRSTDPILHQAIAKCLAVGRQIFVVAPKIEGEEGRASAEAIHREMDERYPGECQLLHGRIKKDEQKEIYRRFLSGEKKILVATTIVEVGIDVSKAALLVVYDANCFGLSSLHQLRGRIGRSGDFALALLVYDGFDKDSQDKLDFLSRCDDGFRISEYDLSMRGAGSYSGERQSGQSELQVCNFVKDFKIFFAAKEDAAEILQNAEEEENARYLRLLPKEETNLI